MRDHDRRDRWPDATEAEMRRELAKAWEVCRMRIEADDRRTGQDRQQHEQ